MLYLGNSVSVNIRKARRLINEDNLMSYGTAVLELLEEAG